MIYLDHNATTPLDDRVLDAMMPYLSTFYGNPSSLYRHGRIVRSAIDLAREQVAALAGAQPSQIVFTSGGTEANNLALTGVNRNLAISAIEHPSVYEPATRLRDRGIGLTVIPVDSAGLVEEGSIRRLAESKPDLVSIMLANNETGVIQNLAALAAMLNSSSILTHTDAVQALGKIPLNFPGLGVDLMSLSSHKIYGPKGCGALVVGKRAKIQPFVLGGGQEKSWRAGTENVAAIVGFGKAAELAAVELAQRTTHLQELRSVLESQLTSIPGVVIFSQAGVRLPNTVQFGLPGVDGEMLSMRFDQKGIAVSSGSACASGGGQPSPVLLAMGIAPELARSALRVSLGKASTEGEITRFIEHLKQFIV